MREVWLEHSEVLNETEVLLVFATKFNRQMYAQYTVINIASHTIEQDDAVAQIIERIQSMTRKDASKAKVIGE